MQIEELPGKKLENVLYFIHRRHSGNNMDKLSIIIAPLLEERFCIVNSHRGNQTNQLDFSYLHWWISMGARLIAIYGTLFFH